MPTSNLGFEPHNEASGRLHIPNPLLQNTISDIFTSLFIIILLSKKTYGNVFAPLFSLLKGSGAFCFNESVVRGNLVMCLAQNCLLNFCGFPIVSFIYHYLGFFLLIRSLQLCHRHIQAWSNVKDTQICACVGKSCFFFSRAPVHTCTCACSLGQPSILVLKREIK